MGRSVQSFLTFVPPKVTHNDLEAYTTKAGGKTVARIRKSDRLKEAEDMMRPHVERMSEKYGRPRLAGPLAQLVKVCWPTEGRHEQGEYMCEKPDADNWVKAFNDLCEHAGLIQNDKLVCVLHIEKMYADPAGVFVRFQELA